MIYIIFCPLVTPYKIPRVKNSNILLYLWIAELHKQIDVQ